MIRKNKNVDLTTLSVGYTTSKEINKALIYVHLLPKDERNLNQEQIIQNLRQKLKKFASKDMFITASAIPNIKGAGVSVPYQIVLTGG